MNNRGGKTPFPEKISLQQFEGYGAVAVATASPAATIKPALSLSSGITAVKHPAKTNGRKNHVLLKDSLFILKRGENSHVVSEDYSYKTDTYYTILQREMKGENIQPSSSAVIDAFVVPICLERAKLAGIPVCEWAISQAYVPLPAIIYGLNYFSTSSEYAAVYDNEGAKEAVRHLTNKGKYPFCYQKLEEGAEICKCTAIFGQTTGQNDAVADIAGKIYALFAIPLVQMVLVKNGGHYVLSSLSPTRYSHLPENERVILEAYLSHQEFL
ncbi:MAG: RimK-like ATPgrasp N-terminal domain-containing protein [Methanoregula sp.]